MQNAQLNGKGSTSRMALGASPNVAPDESYEITGNLYQIDPLRVLWRRLWVILLVTVVVVGIAAAASFLQAPTYQASMSVLLGQGKVSEGDSLSSLQEVQGVQELTATMTEAITTRPVAQEVVEQLDLEMSPEALQAGLSAEQIPETQFIQVYYTGQDPEMAQQILNTVGEVFSEQVSEVSPNVNSITATVWEEALVPTAPISPNPERNILLAAILGLMLGLGLAFLLDYLDDDWKSPEEVEQVSGFPTFGVIPTYKVPKNK